MWLLNTNTYLHFPMLYRLMMNCPWYRSMNRTWYSKQKKSESCLCPTSSPYQTRKKYSKNDPCLKLRKRTGVKTVSEPACSRVKITWTRVFQVDSRDISPPDLMPIFSACCLKMDRTFTVSSQQLVLVGWQDLLAATQRCLSSLTCVPLPRS